jgi:hypothetical protein
LCDERRVAVARELAHDEFAVLAYAVGELGVDEVDAASAADGVGLGVEMERDSVVAEAAEDEVASRTALQIVGAAYAGDVVGCTAAVDRVRSRRAREAVAPLGAGERCAPGDADREAERRRARRGEEPTHERKLSRRPPVRQRTPIAPAQRPAQRAPPTPGGPAAR